jgi:hypothetical protein
VSGRWLESAWDSGVFQPENWKHYIGLNLEDIKGDVERLLDERDKIPEIAENRRTWALAHYSPLATAKRFLGYVTY